MEEYIQQLLGAPYVWWREGSTLGDKSPFWSSNDKPPSIDIIHKEGLNCAGFLNLVCRSQGVKIPGVDDSEFWAGGTWFWFRSLNHRSITISDANELPSGTILLRDYISENDQGHVGIVINKQKIVHCVPDKGLIIEDWRDYKEYFTHAVVGYLSDQPTSSV